MSKNLRLSLALVAIFVVVVAIALAISRDRVGAEEDTAEGTSSDDADTAVPVVRDDSHLLDEAPAGAPVLVEFLDFECEACLAAYPAVEQLRQEYAGEVTFVARYFPIPSHFNAENAAVAVEAAAQQGAFEDMYHLMFETQTEWGELQESRADLFREFAVELGLDMQAYDAAVADPATLERVTSDRDDGIALGVQGTPTFFLDGQRVEARSFEDLRAQIDAAVAAD